jgi:hypothetical protein
MADPNWPLILSIDFDETITQVGFSNFHYSIPPSPGAIETINEFYKDGCIILIWTCRNDLTPVRNYLERYNIPYDKINDDCEIIKKEWGGTRKIYGDIYIDNLNLGGFPGWAIAKQIVQEHPKYKKYHEVKQYEDFA